MCSEVLSVLCSCLVHFFRVCCASCLCCVAPCLALSGFCTALLSCLVCCLALSGLPFCVELLSKRPLQQIFPQGHPGSRVNKFVSHTHAFIDTDLVTRRKYTTVSRNWNLLDLREFYGFVATVPVWCIVCDVATLLVCMYAM